ncbi:MAG: DUF4126 family protein [Blastomonas sp.]
MLRSILIGVVAGSRSMTPLAAVSSAACEGKLPAGNGAPAMLGHPLVVAGTKALAAGEMLGDKMDSAPDRTVPAGTTARIITGAIAAAALAPREQRVLAAMLGSASAVASAYVTLALRKRAMRHLGQKPTGMIEDAMVLAALAWAVPGARDAAKSGWHTR